MEAVCPEVLLLRTSPSETHGASARCPVSDLLARPSSELLVVALTADDPARLHHHLVFQQKLGLLLQWISAAETRRREPHLAGKLAGAVLSPREGDCLCERDPGGCGHAAPRPPGGNTTRRLSPCEASTRPVRSRPAAPASQLGGVRKTKGPAEAGLKSVGGIRSKWH
jgi:hypothetical protein